MPVVVSSQKTGGAIAAVSAAWVSRIPGSDDHSVGTDTNEASSTTTTVALIRAARNTNTTIDTTLSTHKRRQVR
jgi:hypothetical protein